jgi:hypothetical protein
LLPDAGCTTGGRTTLADARLVIEGVPKTVGQLRVSTAYCHHEL